MTAFMLCKTIAAHPESTAVISSSQTSREGAKLKTAQNMSARNEQRMKNKDKPKRERKRKDTGKKRKRCFNPWVAKYFDLTGQGIDKTHKNN
jgi:hypothetical protein